MDFQTNTPPSTPSSSVPNARGVSHATLFAIVLILLLAAGGALAGYYGGYIPNFLTGSATSTSATTGTQNEMAWKSVVDATPEKTIALPVESSDYYTYYYDLYNAGTFLSGRFSGSTLMLGLEKYTYKQSDTGTMNPPMLAGQYVYMVVDKTGKTVGWWQDENTQYPTELGLTNIPVLDKADFPATLLSYRSGDMTLVGSTPDGSLKVQAMPYEIPKTAPLYNGFIQVAPLPVAGFTFNGDPVLRSQDAPNTGAFVGIQPYSYYVKLPTGMLFSATLTPNFMTSETSLPQLTWTTGSTTVASYNYDQYVYGIQDCFASFKDFTGLMSSFVQTGKTVNGDAVFEVNPTGHSDVYQCLYAKTQRYNYDPTTQNSVPYYPATFNDFLTSHPVFFWKNATADWVVFGRSDVVPAAEKAKPVIYLYPTKTEDVNVQVTPEGGFTKTDPAYGSGWNVSATAESVLTDLSDGKTYPYLFWEGGGAGVTPTPLAGFVVAKADVSNLFESKLALLGLNGKERADFKDFWVPKLSKAPYYFITFDSKTDIDRTAPLTVSPAPDTVIRVLMDYKPLQAPVEVEPLQITTPMRTGFTVVEWGGVVRD